MTHINIVNSEGEGKERTQVMIGTGFDALWKFHISAGAKRWTKDYFMDLHGDRFDFHLVSEVNVEPASDTGWHTHITERATTFQQKDNEYQVIV